MGYVWLAAAGGGAWNFGQMLSAAQQTLANYGKLIIGIIGLIMVIVSIYQIAKNLISHGQAQTNWVITFALLIIGGVLMVSSGWDVIKNIAEGGSATLDSLGQGQVDNATFVDPTAIIDGSIIMMD